METIFFAVAKKILRDFAIKARDHSRDADAGVWGGLRDTELSRAKQDLVTDMFLGKFAGVISSDSDAENYQLLRGHIRKLREDAARLALEKNKDEGQFGRVMLQALLFLEYFYEHLQDHQWLDIEKNDQPLHVLVYEAAAYEGAKLAEQYTRMIENTSATDPELSRDKSAMLFKKVHAAGERIASYNKKDEKYPMLVRDTVCEMIEGVIRTNTSLCKEKSTAADVPLFTLSIFGKVSVQTPELIGPGQGRLLESMVSALVKIRGREEACTLLSKIFSAEAAEKLVAKVAGESASPSALVMVHDMK
ncbi:MAG: hypothetical protein JJT82_02320 [Legionellaceae bacterium]|nr:hypothetical protein [Legionellaceae bacterium]